MKNEFPIRFVVLLKIKIILRKINSTPKSFSPRKN